MSNSILLNLNRNYKYVIACSFGPDSMALLDLAIKNKFDIVVAHVNYHKRNVSNFEQKELQKYCAERNIPCEVLDTEGVVSEGNFQEWARELRYKFFKNVKDKYNAFAVVVAHQQDDLIETYLMQKKRGNLVKYWGISRENDIFGVKVIRPLLSYSKQELLDYDVNNSVPYSIDESNLTDHYSRNKIRHSIVEKLSKEERTAIEKEISLLAPTKCEYTNYFALNVFLNMNYEEIIRTIDFYMNKLNEHSDISKKYIEEIKKAFRTKTNVEFTITKSLVLAKNYDEVLLYNSNNIFSYNLFINKRATNVFLEIDFSEGAEDRGIDESQYPLFVKNLNPKDKIKVKNYDVEVRRLFIDWKMPLHLRKMWPGIYNKNGELIYIPRYRKNFNDNHKSIFKINLSKITTI